MSRIRPCLSAIGPTAFLAAMLQGPAHGAVPEAFQETADRFSLPAQVLYAIALTESGRRVDANGTFRPWPWTLNVHGQGHFFSTRQAAETRLRAWLADGEDRIDVGLMQVHWRFHRDALGDPEQALDPVHNLRVAARILQRCLDRHTDAWVAAGCYHAPNHRERAARYRQRAQANWQRHVAQRADGR